VNSDAPSTQDRAMDSYQSEGKKKRGIWSGKGNGVLTDLLKVVIRRLAVKPLDEGKSVGSSFRGEKKLVSEKKKQSRERTDDVF